MRIQETIECGCYFILISLMSGCGLFKKGKSIEASASEQSPQPLPFEASLLGPDDLKVSEGYAVIETSGLDVIDGLNKESLFHFNNKEDNTSESTGDSTPGSWRDENWDCFSMADAAFESNKVSARLMTIVDGSDCVKQQYKELGVEVVSVKATRRFRYYYKCTLGDISVENGKKLYDFEKAARNDSCIQGSYIYQDVIDLDATTIREGVTSVAKRRTVRQMASTDFAQSSFLRSGSNYSVYSIGNGTTYFRKTEKSLKGSAPGTETIETKSADVTQYKFHDVNAEVSASSNIWFDNGKIDVVRNNWTGTLVFRGTKVSPNYTVTSSGTNENLTGSLTTVETK
ncbi:MAG: hypothetical protein FJ146_10005 [Deltaproteobacteria bacterium]|nr:hypothetical protein [Deltaproteobacteria bacterium]